MLSEVYSTGSKVSVKSVKCFIESVLVEEALEVLVNAAMRMEGAWK
jgi:hypothetical protein